MKKIAVVLRELERDEHDLEIDLGEVAAGHPNDPEIHYVAYDLAAWSRDHVRRIATVSEAMDVDLDPVSTRTAWVVPGPSSAPAPDDDPALRLLADLRRLHQRAVRVSLGWELLAQGAQATKDSQLLDLASRCHPDTLRQLRWSNALLKVLSPQALSVG